MSTLKKSGKIKELGNEFKRATDNAKKEYLGNICREIMEYKRTGLMI
jgi:hypothetical protein